VRENIPADRGLGFGVFDNGGSQGDAGAIARAIKSAAIEAYGTAGPEFVRKTIADGITADDVRAMVDKFVRTECPARADGQVERAAQRLGLIMAAGELATALGVTPWAVGDACVAAAWAFKAWLGGRGGSEPTEVSQAVSQVRLFIEQYAEARFDPLDNAETKPSPNRAG
jgi:putative DNA primase/helicase